MRIVLLKMFLSKKSTPIKSIIPDSSAVRTGRFKLIPHGPQEYVLYAEYKKFSGDIHNGCTERSYQPANAQDVAAYYKKT